MDAFLARLMLLPSCHGSCFTWCRLATRAAKSCCSQRLASEIAVVELLCRPPTTTRWQNLMTANQPPATGSPSRFRF